MQKSDRVTHFFILDIREKQMGANPIIDKSSSPGEEMPSVSGLDKKTKDGSK